MVELFGGVVSFCLFVFTFLFFPGHEFGKNKTTNFTRRTMEILYIASRMETPLCGDTTHIVVHVCRRQKVD